MYVKLTFRGHNRISFSNHATGANSNEQTHFTAVVTIVSLLFANSAIHCLDATGYLI